MLALGLRLAKLGMEDWLQWAVAAVSFVITIAVQAEVAILFVGAGIFGVLYYGSLFGRRMPPAPLAAVAPPVAIGAAPHRPCPARRRPR